MKRIILCLILCLAGQTQFAAAQFCPKDKAAIQKFVAEVEKLGGKAEFDPNLPGNVIKLSLASAQIKDVDLKIVQNLSYLRVLDLHYASIKGPGLAYLKNLQQLQELNLSFTSVEDDGLAHLKVLTNLKKLTLHMSCKKCGNITDNGVAHLKALTKLEQLSLDWNQLTDAGLVHLQGMTSLTYLNVGWQSGVTSKGLDELHKALPKTTMHH